MAVKITSATNNGLEGILIKVEVDICKGLPMFNIVGYIINMIENKKWWDIAKYTPPFLEPNIVYCISIILNITKKYKQIFNYLFSCLSTRTTLKSG